MKLYNGRAKIIKLFEGTNIKPSDYPHNEKSEPVEFEQSIAERWKMRRQWSDKKSERTGAENINSRTNA